MSVLWAKGPFWTFGLPFCSMVIGSAYVLARLRADYYYTKDRSGRPLRSDSRHTSLEQDLEVKEGMGAPFHLG